MKGIFEFEVEGKKVGFKFGTYAFSIACEKEGDIDLNTLFKRCGFVYKDEKGKPKSDKAKMKSILHLFYGAAIHYAEDFDQPTNFKVSTVSNWMDEIGEVKLMEIIQKSFFTYEPKNLSSLTENREPVLQ
jgi:hypothetical protein